MRLAWLTDIHLDHASPQAVRTLVEQVREARAEAVLLGGDIATARNVATWLERLRDAFGVPVYFVLGNHDYYGGSIAGVRDVIRRLVAATPGLVWLSDAGVVPLTERTALIGHDGWGDGGYGHAATTPVLLNDFLMIEELVQPRRAQLLARLEVLGAEAAAHLRAAAGAALDRFEQLIVLTHVPPFVEAAWHEGRPSDPDWAPFFACRAAGVVLAEMALAHPGRQITVYCGHTHGGGEYAAAPNLRVVTGPAEYGRPALQRVIEAD